MIKVQSGRKDDRVALWEKNKNHPNGEVFIAGPGVHEVAETPQVMKKLSEGELIRAGSESAPAKKKKGDDEQVASAA